MEFILYFLRVIFFTIGSMILCGVIVFIFNRIYVYFIENSIGCKYLKCASYIGTPVHELGHVIMCLFFGHKILDIKFYSHNDEDGTLGYVQHSYNKKNIFHQIGNLFIGLGPIIIGVFLIWSILFCCYNSTIVDFFNNSIEQLNSGTNYFEIILNTFDLIPSLIMSNTNIVIKILSFFIILAISLHIHLSVSDIKNSISGLLVYTLFSLIFSVITFISGNSIYMSISFALEYFCLLTSVVFSLVIVFSFINVVLAFFVYLTKYFTEM